LLKKALDELVLGAVAYLVKIPPERNPEGADATLFKVLALIELDKPASASTLRMHMLQKLNKVDTNAFAGCEFKTLGGAKEHYDDLRAAHSCARV
jgi:hypothetical protein